MERLLAIRTRVGGNREKAGFEFTFGQPREEQAGITLPAPHIRRTLSQAQFALRLSALREGAYDGPVDAALSLLEQALSAEGVLTRSACAAAEQALLPLSEEAKTYELVCAAHAHIDMNWMWGFDETVAVTLATFRTMLTLMDEYPDFCFSQSQASVYRIVEEYAPEMMDEMKRRIREGRWEVTASAWVETDKNMPDTESLIRHIRLTRDYLGRVWEVPAASLNIDFSPDTFGHSAHLPELNSFGHVRYYYHCRGRNTEDVLFRWRAPSGREVLVYREPYWYNSGIQPEMGPGLLDLLPHNGGLKTGLIVYGVGDHGGGPTRRDLASIREMQAWPVFPKVSFGTFGEYFRRAEAVRDRLPVVDKPLNAIFPGCYTTQSRIKRGNRRTEAALLDAEALTAAACAGDERLQPTAAFDKAWENVLFTHFHDILTGSCVQDSREYAMGLYQQAMAVAGTAQERAMRWISDRIDTTGLGMESPAQSQSEGAGAGYGIEGFAGVPRPERGSGRTRAFHVFNPLPQPRREAVELTVWDWPYDLARLTLTDASGAALPFERVDAARQRYWDHQYFRVLVQVSLPALGYATIVLREGPVRADPIHRHSGDRTDAPHEGFVLENECLRAALDPATGRLTSLFDKRSGRECVRPGSPAGLVLVQTEADTSSAWKIGRYLSEAPVTQTLRLSGHQGPIRQSVTLEQRLLHSTVKATISLDSGADALAYALEIDWHEAARAKEPVPVLVFRVPLAFAPDCVRVDVPAGAMDYAQKRQDVAGLTHAAAVYGDQALALVTDCKYGYRAQDDSLAATLINTATNPDPYPERGIHRIRLWLRPCEASPLALKEGALRLNHAPAYVAATSHPGPLPGEATLLECRSGCAVISSVGPLPGGGLRLRAYECEGKGGAVSVTLPFAPTSAKLTDLEGEALGPVSLDGRVATFSLSPYRLAMLTARP